MGFTLSKPFEGLFQKTEITSVLFGLEKTGKTVLLYRLKLGDLIDTAPTMGFNVEKFNHNNTEFTIWDMGGQPLIRRLWYQYYKMAVQSIIFVVDSTDRERITLAKDELNKILNAQQLKNSTLLVFANKQDFDEVMSVEEIAEKLGLESIKNRKWKIQGISAITGEGIYQGLDWIIDALTPKNFTKRIKNLCPKRV